MTVCNLLYMYHKATPAEVDSGMVWYNNAHNICKDITERNPHLNLAQVCGVMSALSPRNKWERNITDCRTLCDISNNLDSLQGVGVKVSTFASNKAKAINILRLINPPASTVLAQLGGLKVLSFWDNMYYNEHSTAVTVDGHAFCIWLGERRVKATPSPKMYHVVSQDYRDAATFLEVAPLQLQAVTWLAYRRLYVV